MIFEVHMQSETRDCPFEDNSKVIMTLVSTVQVENVYMYNLFSSFPPYINKTIFNFIWLE